MSHREYAIYIHGVSQDNPQVSQDHTNRDHSKTYEQLKNGIGSIEPNLLSSVEDCFIEWGWQHGKPQEGPDSLLANAQDEFSKHIFPQVESASDLTINPARIFLFTLRKLLIKGFSDMFYYVSRDGKNSVRATVASQIMQCISKNRQGDEPISLTFLGHSAGSVVALDFLFYLFASNEILQSHEFVEADSFSSEEIQEFQQLRRLADSGQVRIRRLITFGSPISMLAFRSNTVLKILAEGKQLNPSDYGLDQNFDVFGSPLQGPRWINFWDKDDIISWPVEPLMQNHSQLIKDVYIDVGDRIATVHNEYWNNRIVHEKIAAHW